MSAVLSWMDGGLVTSGDIGFFSFSYAGSTVVFVQVVVETVHCYG